MCSVFGYNSSHSKKKVDLKKRFNFDNSIKAYEDDAIRITNPAVTVSKNSPATATQRYFGITAKWDAKKILFNTRSETIHELRSFKHLFEEQRCLIIATHFYEYKKLEDGTKEPWLFRLKTWEPFAIAGVYDGDQFCMATCEPNAVVKPAHERMTCMLDPDDEDKWIDFDTERDHLLEILKPYPEELMEGYAIKSFKDQTHKYR